MSVFHLIPHPLRQWVLDAGPHTDEAKSLSAAASPHQEHVLVPDPGTPSFRQKASLSFLSPSRTFHASAIDTPILNPGAVTAKRLKEHTGDLGTGSFFWFSRGI